MSESYWRVGTECSLGYIFVGILARLGGKLSNWAEKQGAETGERVLVYSRRSLFGFLTTVGWWGLGVRVQGVLIGWFYLIFVSFSDFSSSQMKSIHVSFGNGLFSVGFYPQLFSGW